MEREVVENETSSTEPQIAHIMHTRLGRRLGRQVDAAVDFVTKGYVMTMMPEFMKMNKTIMKGIAKGEVRDFITKTGQIESLSQKDIRLIEAMETLANEYVDDSSESADAFLNSDDRLRFLSFTVFSAYTYLEVYSRGLVQLIGRKKDLSTMMEAYLPVFTERRSDKSRPPVLTTRDMLHLSLKLRLGAIEEGLGIDGVVADLIGSDTLKLYRDAFARFLELRQKVAHWDPCPDEEEYVYKRMEKDFRPLELDMEDVSNQPPFVKRIMEQVKTAATDAFESFRKITLVVSMAMVYPALIDAVVKVLVSKPKH